MIVQKYRVLLLLLFFVFNAFGQKVTKTITIDSNIIQLDSLSIVPSSFRLFNNGKAIQDSLYEMDGISSTLTWKGKLPITLRVEYVLLSINFSKVYSNKDTSLIQPVFNYKNPFKKSESRIRFIWIR